MNFGGEKKRKEMHMQTITIQFKVQTLSSISSAYTTALYISMLVEKGSL